MATLDWHHTRTDGVTLVELLVTSETTTQVRIESTLTPVWPPKRQGVPAAGWDGHSFEGTVEGGERLVVGYASPARPDGPPARIQTESAASADDVDAETLVRALGEAKPPRDLVPIQSKRADCPKGESTEPQSIGNTIAGPGQQSDTTRAQSSHQQSNPTVQTSDRQPSTNSAAGADTQSGGSSKPGPDESPPPELEAWISTVEGRLADAERLASVESSEEATAAVTAVGGMEGVHQLQTQLVADREQLDRLSELSARLERVEIPTAVLERVA